MGFIVIYNMFNILNISLKLFLPLDFFNSLPKSENLTVH
jgi:hypothetical protein